MPSRWGVNPKLASWVKRQREEFRDQKISPYRVEKLDAIGFTWRFIEFKPRNSDIWEKQWEYRFQQLLAFRKDFGHCRVPRGYKNNPELATWVV